MVKFLSGVSTNAFQLGTAATSGQVLTTDASGNGSWLPVVGGSGITRSILAISTATTAGASASTDYVYLVSGATTLTLPTAVSNTNLYTVKNTGASTVTIAATGAETIDGSTTITLPVSNTSVDLVSDNLNWRVI